MKYRLLLLTILLLFFQSYLFSQQIESISIADSNRKFIELIEVPNGDIAGIYHYAQKNNVSWGIACYDKTFTEKWHKELPNPKNRFINYEELHIFTSDNSIFFLHEKFNKNDQEIILDQYDFSGTTVKSDVAIAKLVYGKNIDYNFYYSQSSDKQKILIYYLESVSKGSGISISCSIFDSNFSALTSNKKITFPFEYGKFKNIYFEDYCISKDEKILFKIKADNGKEMMTEADITRGMYIYNNAKNELHEIKIDNKILKRPNRFFVDDLSKQIFIASYYLEKQNCGIELIGYSPDSLSIKFDYKIPFNEEDVKMVVGEGDYKLGHRLLNVRLDGMFYFSNNNICLLSHSYRDVNHTVNSFSRIAPIQTVTNQRNADPVDISVGTINYQHSILCYVINPKGELVYGKVLYRNPANQSPFYYFYDSVLDKINCYYAYTPMKLWMSRQNAITRKLNSSDLKDGYTYNFPDQELDDTKGKLIFHSISNSGVTSKIIEYKAALEGSSVLLKDKSIVIQKYDMFGSGLLKIKY